MLDRLNRSFRAMPRLIGRLPAVFLCCAALSTLMAACGTPRADVVAVGMCVRGPICTTYTVSNNLNLPEQGAVSAFVQANCATRQGSFTGNVACNTSNTVAYCSNGDAKAQDVDIREVTAFAAGAGLDAEQRACLAQGGSWNLGRPGF